MRDELTAADTISAALACHDCQLEGYRYGVSLQITAVILCRVHVCAYCMVAFAESQSEENYPICNKCEGCS